MSYFQKNCCYIIRFDDICPTMNWAVWNQIESLLDKHSIRPILAVVPDNVDQNLIVDYPCLDFWEQVRRWQSKGYAIALHGYQHKYINDSSGLMRLTSQSEFAGLSREEQEVKLRSGLEIFKNHGVHADAWVAPSHSFDQNTLDVLKDIGIKVISDGLWRRPVIDKNSMIWIPQQLWNFCDKTSGLWTVCFHHNGWDKSKLNLFSRQLSTYSKNIGDLKNILSLDLACKISIIDKLIAFVDLTWNHSPLFKKIGIRRMGSRIKQFIKSGNT
jgi:predicted deacetylase